MAWCDDCDRYFVNEDALQQHIDYSAVHRPNYYCEVCQQHFSSAHGLEQHEANSIKHLKKVWKYVCEPCSWGCNRLAAMQNHDVEFHHWCKQHDRFFQNENDLRQHMRSKSHGQSMECPYCSRTFPTVTGITLHLESGTCASGMNRLKVDKRVHEVDTKGVFTNRKRIGYGDWEPEPDIWATERAWNGSAYECYFCDNEYDTLGRLNGHITRFHAPKRTENIYKCPRCERQFKLCSQLIGHVEHTETCDVKGNLRLKKMLAGGVGRSALTMG